MSDPHMLPFHLPDSYRDAVKTFQSSPGTEESGMSKALFGWVLPASAFGVDSSDNDDDNDSPVDDSSKETFNKQDKAQVPDESAIDTRELRFWRRFPTLREVQPDDDQDEASVGTEGTAELDSDDEWDDGDNGDDWNDTYSVDSSDDEGSLVGEDTYDSFFARNSTTFQSPSDFYFNPTPKDFPIERTPVPVKATEPIIDKAEDQEADSPDEKPDSPPKFDFWAGVTQTIDKVKSFTDDAIKEMCRKAEEAKRKKTEEREAEERNKIKEQEREIEDTAKATATSRRVPRNQASRSRRDGSKRPRNEKDPFRTHRARLSQIPPQYLPRQHRMVREHPHFSSSRNLDMIDSPFNPSQSVFRNNPSLARSRTQSIFRSNPALKRSRTQDNLAQFFTEPDAGASRSMDPRERNMPLFSHQRTSSQGGQHDKFMHASKERFMPAANGSSNRMSSKSNDGRTKPTHRRTASQRSIPALGQCDFPSY